MFNFIFLLAAGLMAPAAGLKIDVSSTAGAASSPHMYGIMFEVVLYQETPRLASNRS